MSFNERLFGLASGTIATTIDALPERMRVDALGPPDSGVVLAPGKRSFPCTFDGRWVSLVKTLERATKLSSAVRAYAVRYSEHPSLVLEAIWPTIERLSKAGFLLEEGKLRAENDRHDWNATLSAGQSVEHWRVERQLYTSDDVEVYVVSDKEGAKCALKIARKADGPKADPGMNSEIAILRSVPPDVTPAIVQTGTFDRRPYLVALFVENQPLLEVAAHLRTVGQWSDLRRLILRICAAYAKLSAEGIVHGDVHPRNVIVGTDGQPFLIDFGSSILLSSEGPLSRIPCQSPFLSPEVAAQTLVGVPSITVTSHQEQYSVAALLWYVAAGEHHIAFSTDPDTQLRQIIRSELQPPSRQREELLASMLPTLTRALAASPHRRFSSISEFLSKLNAAC